MRIRKLGEMQIENCKFHFHVNNCKFKTKCKFYIIFYVDYCYEIRVLCSKNFLIVLVIQPIRTSVCMQQKRFKSKVNIQRPRLPHFERAKVMKFATPFISNPDTHKHWKERCTNVTNQKKKKIVNPYEVFLAKECLNWLRTSNMIGFLHFNPIKGRKVFECAVALKKQNMYLKAYQTSIIELAVKGTIYEAIMSLMLKNKSVNYMICSPGTDTTELTKILKKTPEFILLAGILHGRLLCLNDFLRIGALDLPSTQAGLVQVLKTAAGGNLNRQLMHHPSTLVTRLTQIGTKEDKPCDVNE